MKIRSINFKESGSRFVTLNTQPKLEQVIFEHFKMLAVNEPALKNFGFDMSVTSALTLTSGQAIGSNFTPDFLKTIERVLSSAESLVENEIRAKRGKADQEFRDKKAAIQAMSEKLGIPIE